MREIAGARSAVDHAGGGAAQHGEDHVSAQAAPGGRAPATEGTGYAQSSRDALVLAYTLFNSVVADAFYDSLVADAFYDGGRSTFRPKKMGETTGQKNNLWGLLA